MSVMIGASHARFHQTNVVEDIYVVVVNRMRMY